MVLQLDAILECVFRNLYDITIYETRLKTAATLKS